MIIFHTQLIDPTRGIIRASVCHCLSDAKATLAAYMVDYTAGMTLPNSTGKDVMSIIEWFNQTQEDAVIACSAYDTDEERHTEFVATDEQDNKPLLTVEEALALADDDDDEDDDDLLMSMGVAGHA